MNTEEFRDWLGSDLATRQLAAALEDSGPCDGCGGDLEEGCETDPYDIFDGRFCLDCYRDLINDLKKVRLTVDLEKVPIGEECRPAGWRWWEAQKAKGYSPDEISDAWNGMSDEERNAATAEREEPDEDWRRGRCPACGGWLVSNAYRVSGKYLLMLECWNSLKANAGEINTCQYRRVL